MDNELFLYNCKKLVVEYVNTPVSFIGSANVLEFKNPRIPDIPNITIDDVYEVWHLLPPDFEVKKVLLTTTKNDGMHYELTYYNEEGKDKIYFRAFKICDHRIYEIEYKEG